MTSSVVGQTGYGITTTEYDDAGRMFRTMNQTGWTNTYAHDFAGRMVENIFRIYSHYPNGTADATSTYTYDRVGRLLTAAKVSFYQNVANAFVYDKDGRIASESKTAYSSTQTHSRQYDQANRLTKIVYPDNSAAVHSYNARGLLTVLQYDDNNDGAGLVTIDTRGYDNAGRLISSALGNSVTTDFDYRADNLLSSIDTTGIDGCDFDDTYDANKNKTSAAINGVMSNYGFNSTTYDDEDRLTAWSRTDGNQDQSWSLTTVGDSSSFTQEGTTVNRTHGPARELTAVGSTSLPKDLKGCDTITLAGHNITLYIDTNLIRHIRKTDGTYIAAFNQDALERRVLRQDFTPTGSMLAESVSGQASRRFSSKAKISDTLTSSEEFSFESAICRRDHTRIARRHCQKSP